MHPAEWQQQQQKSISLAEMNFEHIASSGKVINKLSSNVKFAFLLGASVKNTTRKER